MHRIDIDLQRSPLFLSFIITLLIASIMIIFTLPTYIGLKIALTIGVLIYGCKIIHHHGLLKGQHTITKIIHEGEFWLIGNHTDIYPAKLCSESTISNLVCILRFQTPHRKYSCIVCKDALSKNTYRQLIVQLRTSHAQDAELQRISLPTA